MRETTMSGQHVVLVTGGMGGGLGETISTKDAGDTWR